MQHREIQKQIGIGIIRFRKKRRMSQAELAQRAGMLRTQITRLENGHSNVTIKTLCQVADALDVPVQAFFRWRNENACR